MNLNGQFADAQGGAPASSSHDSPVTLAAIESLLVLKVTPVNTSIHELQTEFAGLRISMEHRLRDFETRMGATD
eukprot:7971799-Heterocapsa_arctica.AAC.1